MTDKELVCCAIDKKYHLNGRIAEHEIDKRNKISESIEVLSALDDEAMIFLYQVKLGRMTDGELRAKMNFYEWIQPYLLKLDTNEGGNTDVISQKREKASCILGAIRVILYREIFSEHERRGKFDEYDDWMSSIGTVYGVDSRLLNIF